MTKYILHGGNAQEPNPENDKFFSEILKDSTDNPKILLVHFASDPDKTLINKEESIAQFEKAKGVKTLELELANEELFIEQVKRNDIIYFGGGTTQRLLDTLKKYSNLKSLFEGKVVAGESAGANALSTFGHSKAASKVFEGLGILPVKTIPHYKEGLENVFEGLDDSLENVFLKEYEYRVFEV